MYNKKSRISAILLIVTVALLIGFMIMLPFLQYKQVDGDGDLGAAIGSAVEIIIVIVFAYPAIYVSSATFCIVALVFGIKMFKQQSRKKLIGYNKRMLITTCVILPFLAFGLAFGSEMLFNSTLGVFPIIYTVLIALAYLACLVMQIVTIILLKKMPEEVMPEDSITPVSEQGLN